MGREKGKGGEFWDAPKKPDAPAKPPMKTWKKAALFGGGGLLLLVVVLVALAPSIAGAVAPGIISDAAAESVKGPVSVSRASFSWTGTQKIGPVTIVDPTKPAGSNHVATVSVEIDRGLAGLIGAALGGAPDLGEIRVKGDARIVRYPDGTTNLDRALEPVLARSKGSGGSSKGPAKIERGTEALVLIDAVDVTYEDAAGQSAAIRNLRGEAYLGPGDAGTLARVKLTAKATGAGDGAEGTLRVDVKAGPIAGDDGVVRPEKLKVEATVEVNGLPTALVDSLAGMGGKLAAALGPALTVNVTANGSMKSANASIGVTSRGATVAGELAMADSVLTTSAPLKAALTADAFRELSGLEGALKASGMTLKEAPSVAVTVEGLRVALPASGGAFDPAGAAGKVTLRTTGTSGTLTLPGEAGPSEFRTSPLEAVVSTESLAGEVRLVAAGEATIGGKPAGALSADLTATNPLEFAGAGATKGAGPSVRGAVSLKGIATAIAQPLVAGAGLELARDIGPALDAEVKLVTGRDATGVGNIPPMTAEIAVASQKLNAKGGFALRDSALTSEGGPFTLSADALGGLIARFLPSGAPYTIAPGGKLAVAVSDVRVPFKDGQLGKAQLDRAGASLSAKVEGLEVVPASGAPEKLSVASFVLGVGAAPGAAPRVEVNGSMAYGGKPFSLAGAMELPGLYSFAPDGSPLVTPVGARPKGSIDLKGVPTGLVSLFTAGKPDAPGGGEPALDMGKFVADVIGPGVDVKVTSEGRDAQGVELGVALRAERLVADVRAGLSDQAIDVKRVSAEATVAPSALETVLATYAPNLSPRPRLSGVSKLTVAAEPVSIPVGRDKDGAARLDLARAGIATLRVSLPQQTLLEKMVLKKEDGSTTDLGQVGVEGLELTAKVPLAALDAATATGQKFDVALTGRVLDGPGSAMLRVTGTVGGEVGGAGLRAADANLRMTDVKVASIDRLLGKPGLIAGAVGDAAAVTVDAKVRQAPGGTGLATSAEVAVQSAKVKMLEPLRVSVLPDRITADRPVQVSWTMDPAWANLHLFAPAPGATKPPATLAAPVNATLTVSKFAISAGEGRGPLAASVFDLDAVAALATVELAMPDGSTVRLASSKIDVESAPGGPTAGPDGGAAGAQSAGVAFWVKVDDVTVIRPGANAEPTKAMTLTGRVDGLSDHAGNLTPRAARVTASGDIPAMPTAVLDLLAKQNGLLLDLLGPTTSARLRAEQFGATGGTIDLVASSERASANVRGSIGEGVFVSSEPIKASISEVTAALAQRFAKRMPLIGTVEKRSTDDPAVFTASAMRVPLDNDMRKLEGEVVIDPGVARFTSGDTFGKILKSIQQKSESNFGERIEPLNIHIKQGVATYDRWTVPIGPNKLATKGTVDLVNERVDIVTYVPLGALTEDVAGLFQAQAAAQRALGVVGLDNALMVPIRSRGPFSAVKTEPDMELFVKETLSNLRPDRVIERAIDNLFKPKEGGGGK